MILDHLEEEVFSIIQTVLVNLERNFPLKLLLMSNPYYVTLTIARTTEVTEVDTEVGMVGVTAQALPTEGVPLTEEGDTVLALVIKVAPTTIPINLATITTEGAITATGSRTEVETHAVTVAHVWVQFAVYAAV